MSHPTTSKLYAAVRSAHLPFAKALYGTVAYRVGKSVHELDFSGAAQVGHLEWRGNAVKSSHPAIAGFALADIVRQGKPTELPSVRKFGGVGIHDTDYSFGSSQKWMRSQKSIQALLKSATRSLVGTAPAASGWKHGKRGGMYKNTRTGKKHYRAKTGGGYRHQR